MKNSDSYNLTTLKFLLNKIVHHETNNVQLWKPSVQMSTSHNANLYKITVTLLKELYCVYSVQSSSEEMRIGAIDIVSGCQLCQQVLPHWSQNRYCVHESITAGVLHLQ